MDASRLKAISLFESLSDEQLHSLSPFVNETSVSKGKHLVDEGDYSYEFIAIEEGTAEVTRGGDHVADLGPGEFFGEIGVLEKDLRTATVISTSPMRLITLSGWDLKRLGKASPETLDNIRTVIESRR